MDKGWKNYGIICGLALMTGFTLFAEPHIFTENQDLEEDEKKVFESSRKIIFSDDIYINLLEKKFPNTPTLINNKWGDYYFGLSMGQRPKSNTGWDVFYFCDILGSVNGKLTQINGTYPTECYMIKPQQGTMVNFSWKVPDSTTPSAPAQSVFSLQLTMLPGYPNWLFGKVSATGKDSLLAVRLNCRPGGSGKYHRTVETESWFACTESDQQINKAIDINLKTPGIIAYNRFAREDQGCFAVTDPEQVNYINISGGSRSVLRFFPKKGTDFIFAIGIFDGENYEQANNMFLSETQDIILNRLKMIDWQPKVSPDYFEKLLKSTLELATNPEAKAEAEKLADEWQKADKEGNAAKRNAIETKLKVLKDKLIQQALSEYL